MEKVCFSAEALKAVDHRFSLAIDMAWQKAILFLEG
jgi:hypothetical protein